MKSYLSYIDSEIRWIGKIPKHWKVSRIKYTDLVVMGQSPKSEDYNQEGIGLPFLQGNADFTCLHPIPRVWCDNATKTAEKGDLLLSVRAPIGAVNIADQSYGIGRGLCAIKAEGTIPRFLYYCLLSMNEEFICNGTGSTFTAISSEDVRESFIPCIPASEQRYIADYLDRNTAQIDALIAKKQHQIELLQEQRTAIITQAVTKGLDPSVPMKDSGFDWLGKFPDHWNLKRIKYIAPRRVEQVNNNDENGLLVSLDSIESKTGKLIGNGTFEGQGNKFAKGDVLFCKLRPYLCKVIIAPQGGIAVSDLLVLVPSEEVEIRYLFYRLIESNFISVVDSSTYGAKMPRASWDFISNLKCPLPPVAEQQAIADFLDKQISRIDIMVERIFQQIALIQEYRTALISEAVTGKIDVRGEA